MSLPPPPPHPEKKRKKKKRARQTIINIDKQRKLKFNNNSSIWVQLKSYLRRWNEVVELPEVT